MRFTPKTDEQIATEGLCPEGWFEAEVIDAQEKTSAKGNDMIALKLKVYSNNGERTVYDYLLETFAYKLKHFCTAASLDGLYNDGTLTADDCLGKLVEVQVEHETPLTGQYAGKTQARVADYRVLTRRQLQPKPAANKPPAPTAKQVGTARPAKVEPAITEEEIPF